MNPTTLRRGRHVDVPFIMKKKVIPNKELLFFYYSLSRFLGLLESIPAVTG